MEPNKEVLLTIEDVLREEWQASDDFQLYITLNPDKDKIVNAIKTWTLIQVEKFRQKNEDLERRLTVARIEIRQLSDENEMLRKQLAIKQS